MAENLQCFFQFYISIHTLHGKTLGDWVVSSPDLGSQGAGFESHWAVLEINFFRK